MNMTARLLLLVCAVAGADAFAADPTVSDAGQPLQTTPPQAAEQSTAGPSTRDPKATPSDPASSDKSQTPATANPQTVASKPGKKVLVDDTVNDAQLKQILSRGYKPEAQARGNEVYYCRSEREMGTRFEKKVCKTATRILDDEMNGKEETTRLERTSGNPAAK
jgi:hypothetical protein